MSEIVIFGTWLQQRRKFLDLTQEKLAERVSCSLTAIQKIENGSRKPSRQIAERLAECLSLPPEQYDFFVLFARSGGGSRGPGSPPKERRGVLPESLRSLKAL